MKEVNENIDIDTIAYLNTKPNMVEDLKLPEKYPNLGYYPTKYRYYNQTNL